MIKYNDNSVFVGQIKQVLKDFNLPKCRVFREELQGKFPNGYSYIKDDKIYTYLENEDGLNPRTVASYDYYNNANIPNLTTNLKISNLIYDSYTHKYLGRYLRFLKDYYKVDLMSMYNCFSNESINNLNTEEMQSEDGFVIYSVPVRFFESYTIGINSDTSVEFMVSFVGKDGLIDVPYRDELQHFTYTKKSSMSLNHPFVYKALVRYAGDKENYVEFLKQEDNLRLLIKVPIDLQSSIVVVEGDFHNNFNIDYATGELPKPLITEDGPIEYLSKLQLFASENATQNGLLADRLMEYITRNAITPLSEYYDIKKVQKALLQANLIDQTMYGTWDENIRKAIYKYISNLGLNSKYYDMISYVDKDVESAFANLVVGGLV